jgi:predicted GNAT superfamily acetyltransferase
LRAVKSAGGDVVVGPASRERLLECELLARNVFGFSDRETIPAWQLHTSTLFGGVALAAQLDGAVVGFAFAFPGVAHDGRFLFLTELSVAPQHRSLGIGMRLLGALREAAMGRGYARVKWTTSSVSCRNLYIYLARCRACIVRIHPLMYQGLIAGVPKDRVEGDEVELDWHLDDEAVASGLVGRPRVVVAADEPREVLLTRTADVGGVRTMEVGVATDVDPGRPRYLVEVPWDVESLRAAPAELQRGWRDGVRAAMTALLDAGYRGVDMRADAAARRGFVVFEPRSEGSGRPFPDGPDQEGSIDG